MSESEIHFEPTHPYYDNLVEGTAVSFLQISATNHLLYFYFLSPLKSQRRVISPSMSRSTVFKRVGVLNVAKNPTPLATALQSFENANPCKYCSKLKTMTRILGALALVQGMFHDTSDLLLLSLRIPNLVPDLSLSINFYLLHSSAQFIQQTQHSVPTPWKEQSVATRWHSVNNRWSQ